MMARAELVHGLPQAGELVAARNARMRQVVLDHARLRQRRAIGPDGAGQVQVGARRGAAVGQPAFDLAQGSQGHAVAGHRQHVASVQVGLQPLQVLGCVRHAQLHQADAAAGQLLLGLGEIA